MKSEPVVSAQAIAAAVSTTILALVAMLVSLGVFSLDTKQMGAIEAFLAALGALAVLVGPQLAAAWWARSKVTPVANPKAANGEPLVPMSVARAAFFEPDTHK
jgi:hypothetical protein